MAKEYVEFKEVVELFAYSVASELKSEREIPKVNIIFPESAFKIFEYVKNHPFTKEGYIVPDIRDSDIENLRPENQSDPSCPTIYVRNPVQFFELLTELINVWLDHKEDYFQSNSGRAVLIHEFKRLLLRMNVSDFVSIEEFLKQQIDFFKSKDFNEYIIRDNVLNKSPRVGTFENNKILAIKKDAASWCETSNKISFALFNEQEMEDGVHTLPSVYYGIREENGEKVCYIYAIQNERERAENKKIARSLYKLNKGIENSNVHPSQVLSLKTFIDMLTSIGVKNIKVPCRQILSYRYHEILSREAKKSMKKWTPEYLEELRESSSRRSKRELEEYEWDKVWASHVIDREDEIEMAKTEGLFNVFYRIAEQFESIDILNDPFIEDEYLNIRIKDVKKLSKSI